MNAALRRAAICAVAWAMQAATAAAPAAEADACQVSVAVACYRSFAMPQRGGTLHFYASRAEVPDAAGPSADAPTKALIALHGHPRDANKTFDAALLAVRNGGMLRSTVVIALLFQVDPGQAAKCSTPGVPAAEAGDLLWTCGSWMEGGSARNGTQPTSFAAMDALVAEVLARWPSVRTVTVAGFSAGAQFVQHYIGFAAQAQAQASAQASASASDSARSAVALRYVVADPGSWLYFDAFRPQPANDGDGGACPGVNRWKYGTDDLPPALGRDAAAARRQYAAADIAYLEGERDSGSGRGTAHRLLDKSCAAMAQGRFRLQRGLAYADYDRALLAPDQQRRLVVVPGCAHDVACVFPAEAARSALLGTAP